jgi:fatty-acyl-CoA synthase
VTSVSISSLLAEAADSAEIAFGPMGAPESVRKSLDSFEGLVGGSADAAEIITILTNDATSVAILLKAIHDRVPLISLPAPPSHGRDRAAYELLIRGVLARSSSKGIVASDLNANALRQLGVSAIGHSELGSLGPLSVSGSKFTLTQFTSGTVAVPKPVTLDDAQLGGNVVAICRALQVQEGDSAVSWLPLSHDMGLVGMLLTSVISAHPTLARRTRLTLLEPATFLRRPQVWPDLLAQTGASFTAAPDFAFRLLASSTTHRARDLSRLRVAIVGGEVVRAGTLNRFADDYRSWGLREEAICPAYGLAEIGLCATMTPPHERWREASGPMSTSGWSLPQSWISSGRPIEGVEVCIAPTSGRIRLRSAYLGTRGYSDSRFGCEKQWYETGDVGFIEDGWLYVTGRDDDMAVVNGRNVSLCEIDVAVREAAGVRRGRAVALQADSGEVVVVVEAAAAHRSDEVRRNARRASVSAVGVAPTEVLIVRRGSIPITASGKVRRREALRLFRLGAFSAAGSMK